MSIAETATTVVKTLEGVEAALIMLFEQQQHLSKGSLSSSDERSLFASQLSLMVHMKSALQVARLQCWSLIVPEVQESAPEVTVYRCEPADEDEA